MKSALFALIACACPLFVSAQTAELMPEGSHETYIGLLATVGPKAMGSKDKELLLAPNFSIRWANGVFIDGLRTGVNLSSDPSMRFGPLVGLGWRKARTDSANEKGKWGIDGGAFFNYSIAHNLSFNTNLAYGDGNDGRGVHWQLGGSYNTPLAQHHSVTLTAGVDLADAAYMRSYLEPRDHSWKASSGLEDSYAGVIWHAQLSNKLQLDTSAFLNQLSHRAASSPLVMERSTTRLSTVLNYRF
jgi:outer membrane scaffolding protein for murein synthesis (MipA/OmpV family)